MEHYRVNKVTKPGGPVVKTKDVLAPNPKQAVKDAQQDPDCPVCEIWHAGRKIGAVT